MKRFKSPISQLINTRGTIAYLTLYYDTSDRRNVDYKFEERALRCYSMISGSW